MTFQVLGAGVSAELFPPRGLAGPFAPLRAQFKCHPPPFKAGDRRPPLPVSVQFAAVNAVNEARKRPCGQLTSNRRLRLPGRFVHALRGQGACPCWQAWLTDASTMVACSIIE